MFHLVVTALGAPVALPGCPETCGNLTVPYPFGIRQGCFHEGFDLTCDETHQPPKLFLGDGVEVLGISLPDGTVRIRSRLMNARSLAFNGSWSAGVKVLGHLALSAERNLFVAIGCNFLARLSPHYAHHSYASICATMCEEDQLPLNTSISHYPSSCSGVGCCQTSIAQGFPSYGILLTDFDAARFSFGEFAAFIADREWFSENQVMLQKSFFSPNRQVMVNSTVIPAVLEWSFSSLLDHDLFRGFDSSGWRCMSANSIFVHADGNNHVRSLCSCSKGYEGNPYITNGCQGNLPSGLAGA